MSRRAACSRCYRTLRTAHSAWSRPRTAQLVSGAAVDAPLDCSQVGRQANFSGQRGTRRKPAGQQRGRAALARHGACARSARRLQNPSFSKTRFFHSGQFRALRGAGETDPTATLAAHATAAGTTGPTGPTNPERVDDVRVLVSSSDIERTDLAPVLVAVYRVVLRVSKVRVARAVEAVRGAHLPGGCCGQRSA